MDHSNIIDINQYRKLRKRKLESFAYRVQYDEGAHSDVLILLIVSCSIAILSFFLIFCLIYKYLY